MRIVAPGANAAPLDPLLKNRRKRVIALECGQACIARQSGAPRSETLGRTKAIPDDKPRLPGAFHRSRDLIVTLQNSQELEI
jgi:hypothetical protein